MPDLFHGQHHVFRRGPARTNVIVRLLVVEAQKVGDEHEEEAQVEVDDGDEAGKEVVVEAHYVSPVENVEIFDQLADGYLVDHYCKCIMTKKDVNIANCVRPWAETIVCKVCNAGQ